MAEKINVTEVQALTALVEFAKANEFDNAEVIEKAEHMIEVRSRKRERKTDNSKTLANIALGEEFLKGWTEPTFKAADIAEALNVSRSKASAIARACEWDEVDSKEKVKVYKTPDAE